ncbi:hypothetical protein POTOM_041466 [Populus tomentosa]|uniref:Berberine/berberine-like domain-containing protein n=1 Tax=Populus tomentosa TaxID=118781 RepID=A0A8X7YLV9_POPTO|nr:hypothetical protein POTOM_041466 [Populus tomentosa]
MGEVLEDLFWAIRGGGGNTFGVVVAWKLKFGSSSTYSDCFTVPRTLEQNATKLVHRWQSVASKLHKDLNIALVLRRINSSEEGKTTILAAFTSLFLGGVDRLLPLMQESFPELGLVKEDCIEMSWIKSVLYVVGFPSNASSDVLLGRTPLANRNYKGKSDYVKEPMPETALEGIWERFLEADIDTPQMVWAPYGGKMDEISETSVPFPHRSGNLYKIQDLVFWDEEGNEASKRHISWIRRLYDYLTPYVSKNPRAAYVNYRDLDVVIDKQVFGVSNTMTITLIASTFYRFLLLSIAILRSVSDWFTHSRRQKLRAETEENRVVSKGKQSNFQIRKKIQGITDSPGGNALLFAVNLQLQVSCDASSNID